MNKITLAGIVTESPKLSHEVYGEKLYRFYLSSSRQSGTVDVLPCVISEVFIKDIVEGSKIKVIGEIRTRNVQSHLEIIVFVKEMHDYSGDDENEVYMQGYICKESISRETPLGRQIRDFIIASNRTYGKSDYIPCIAWGRNAINERLFEVGNGIEVTGRLQSREYIKKYQDGNEETKIAYEVSTSRIIIKKEDVLDESND